jgi:adenylate kinase
MNLIVLEPPGAGKGAQSQKIESNRGLKQLSTEGILRAEIASGSELCEKLKPIVDADQAVPDDVMVAMIAARISAADCADGFILDGFPRSVAQAEALDAMLEERETRLDLVIQIVVDQEAMVSRVSGGIACEQCGNDYHEILRPPEFEGECDDCGPTDFIRYSAESPQTVRARLTMHHETVAPLIPHYRDRGVLKEVDGMATVEGIAKQIEDLLDRVSTAEQS